MLDPGATIGGDDSDEGARRSAAEAGSVVEVRYPTFWCPGLKYLSNVPAIMRKFVSVWFRICKNYNVRRGKDNETSLVFHV